jgi:hypothetical protein
VSGFGGWQVAKQIYLGYVVGWIDLDSAVEQPERESLADGTLLTGLRDNLDVENMQSDFASTVLLQSLLLDTKARQRVAP